MKPSQVLGVVMLIPLLQIGASEPRQDCSFLPPSDAPAAAPNDNRTPAGRLENGVLTIELVLQEARWYPEGPEGCAVEMFVFTEEGRTPETPGPLIRVLAGTEIRASVRNATGLPILIRGMHDRSRDSVVTLQVVDIAPGATEDIAFRVTAEGTWFYHAIAEASRAALFVPAGLYSQAVGGLIVDPAGGSPPDRVLVMTRWRGPPPPSPARARGYEITAINGLSWPHTERITATVGDTVRWRVIAANNDGHAMHLHGFYFTVERKGNAVIDTVYTRADERLMVTEPMGPATTMTIRWVPEREGNWIFHCHLMRHMSAAQRLERIADSAPGHGSRGAEGTSHAMHEMAGLVLGITVQPRPGTRPAQPLLPLRELRLFANERNNVFGEHPGYGFILQENDVPPARDSVRIPGSPLILTRGQPVRINVINRLRMPLSVHWHGIELDSYVDGVAGWSGIMGNIAPPIAPNDSFDVRFTPPRAGTFIYHVHNEQGEELPSGLYGPLVVMEPGVTWDAAADRLVVISEPGPGNPTIGQSPRPPFVNGSAAPDTMEMVSGRTYRFRFIAIPANAGYQVELKRGAALEEWRPIARDGADLAAVWSRPGPARHFGLGAGMTIDYAFTPGAPGDLRLEIDPLGPPGGAPQRKPTVIPIRVREP